MNLWGALKGKPKSQLRFQDARDARIVGNILRKGARTKWNYIV